jgi:hypothetical protein
MFIGFFRDSGKLLLDPVEASEYLGKDGLKLCEKCVAH